MNRSLESALWSGALLLSLAAALWLGSLAALAVLGWSVLVWPLHRRRAAADGADWPPPYAVELWQTAVGLGLLTAAAYVAAYLTEARLLQMLFVPVAALGAALSMAAAAYLSVRAVLGYKR